MKKTRCAEHIEHTLGEVETLENGGWCIVFMNRFAK